MEKTAPIIDAEPVSEYGVSILFAENNAEIRDMLWIFLQYSGHTNVTPFKSAEELLAAARLNPPGIILTNINLAGPMTGIGLIRTIKSDRALMHIPMILMSAEATQEKITQLVDSAQIAYGFVEPYETQEVIQHVQDILRRMLQQPQSNPLPLAA